MQTATLMLQFISPSRRRIIGTVLLLGFCPVVTTAAVRTWTGTHATSGNWNLRENWGGVAVPAHGDTLVFPSGAARLFNTNNIAGLRLNAIQFAGAVGGYNLRGLGVTVTNGITLIEGSSHTIHLNIVLGGTQAIHIPSGGAVTFFSDIDLNGFNLSLAAIGDLTMRGAISGNGNVSKSGAGELSLFGVKNNTFNGSLTIASGTLAMNRYETISVVPLNQVSRVAVPGNLILGNGSGTVLAKAYFNHQIADTGAVTVNEDATLDFNGHHDTVGDLVLKGGVIHTGAGTLTLGGNVTSLSSADSAVINGLVFLGGHRTLSVADGPPSIDLDVRANIDGGIAHVTKSGAGTLRFGGTNTYLGMTYVNGGQLNAGNDTALGTANGTTVVNTNAQLLLEHGVDTLEEHLTLSGAGIGGTNAALRVAGSATIQYGVTLDAPATINVPFGSGLGLNGVVSGTGPLTKSGGGTLQLAGNSANTFTGGLMAEEGLLLLSKLAGSAVQGDLVIGTTKSTATARHTRSANLGGAVTVNAGSLYDLDGVNESIDSLTLNGGGDVQTGAGQLTVDGDVIVNAGLLASGSTSTIDGRLGVGSGVRHFIVAETGGLFGDSADLLINARISGGANIIKSGSGDLSLTASNNFTGQLTVEDGELLVSNDYALGSTAANTVLTGASIIHVSGNLTVDENLFLNTSGKPNVGALRNQGTNLWTGSIFLGQTTVLNVPTNSEFNISGFINGLGGLTKTGPGLLVYSGTVSNTYIGATMVNEGTLRLQRGGGANRAIPGALIVGDGVGGLETDVVEAVAPSQINNLAAVTVNSSGALRFLADDIIGSLAGGGRVELQGGLTELQTGGNDASTSFAGLISGSGGLRKLGSGRFILTGDNIYTGFTTVSDGTLIVNGEQPSSDVIVQAGGTLGGNGDVGDLTVFGTLAPGNPSGQTLGQLQAASVDFQPGSHYVVQLGGPMYLSGHDSLLVAGDVDLTGATLDVSLEYAPIAGEEFGIVFKDSAGLATGAFNGLPEGAQLVLNRIPLSLSYAKGSGGNNATLTVGELPLRLAAARVEAGNGNGRIDPDECDNLFLTLENATGAGVNVVGAHLHSLRDAIIVTQGEGLYGTIPTLGFRTNRAAFQIRSAPAYPCGQNAEFHLVVDTAAHGHFAIPVTLPTGSPGAFRAFPSGNGPQVIPDLGALSSQLPLADSFRIGKVRVSLHASHPAVGDLRFRLRSPSGTEVVLAANQGGNMANYGNNCSSRATFDDDAATKITAAAAPFAGTFAPEGNLADFIGETSSGIWTLLAEDTVAGDFGALQCWTLQLAPSECASGGGGCESCLAAVNGSLSDFTRTMPNRLLIALYPSGCGDAKPCKVSGPWSVPPYRYSTHAFTNTGPEACVTVVLSVPCVEADSGLIGSAYLGDFNPEDLCANYLGSTGRDIKNGPGGFSFRVPAGQRFTVVVNELNNNALFQGCDSYSLELYGLPCPQEQPRLLIANDAGPDKVRLHWSTAYPGFQLQGKPNLGGPGIVSLIYTNVTTAPTVHGGHYSVTNSAGGGSGFFRLRKP